jgi:hypothetical protein
VGGGGVLQARGGAYATRGAAARGEVAGSAGTPLAQVRVCVCVYVSVCVCACVCVQWRV